LSSKKPISSQPDFRVQAVVQLSEHPEFVTSNPGIPWPQMRGTRNRVAHGYFDINLEIVWETVFAGAPASQAEREDLRMGSAYGFVLPPEPQAAWRDQMALTVVMAGCGLRPGDACASKNPFQRTRASSGEFEVSLLGRATQFSPRPPFHSELKLLKNAHSSKVSFLTAVR
jgi:hypothetical protein